MKRLLVISALISLLFGCNDEAYESNTGPSNNNPGGTITDNFLTIGSGSYWIYDVQSSSENSADMEFTAQDSIYVLQTSGNMFTLGANDGNLANGSMNGILTNGTHNISATTLTFDGNLQLPDTFSDLGIDNDLGLSGLVLYDLESNDDDIMFTDAGNASETLDLEGNEIPIEVSYEVTTRKVNFHDSKTLNNTTYNNVFEGMLTISVGVNGTIDLGLFTQNVDFLEPQNILETTYYYAENIGLVRAQSTLGFSLSSQLTSLLQLANIPIEFPTSLMVENVEELNNYFVD